MIMRFRLSSLRILKEYMSKNRAYQDHYSFDSGAFLLLRKLMNSNRTIAAIIITDLGSQGHLHSRTSTLGSLRLRVGRSGTRTVNTGQSSEQVASIYAVILHVLPFKNV